MKGRCLPSGGCASAAIRQHETLSLSRSNKMPSPSAILTSSALPKAGPFPTLDPFLFCVYHKDHYPNGNVKMEAPKWGNGQDFDPSLPYRMYHGERIPG